MPHRNLKESIGFPLTPGKSPESDKELIQFINIKLASLNLPIYGDREDYPFLEIGKSLFLNLQAKDRLLGEYLPPADQSIQDYLSRTFADAGIKDKQLWLPANTFKLERHGLARAISLPPDQDKFESNIIKSYRTTRGVLHNPKHDRRTTKGVFHVAEGGSPIPFDKKAVPLPVFANLLKQALQPPEELLELPFTSTQTKKARTWVSLLLRPLLCPAIPGVTPHKSMEVRFFAPGNLVANLDFVESIFGNAGSPLVPENDARLDTDHWSGHTGCVILAPHLIRTKKKDLGLPHIREASERQKRDGMCWESPEELYNDGQAFKITCRNHEGIIVTLIADNYFGYCKKEVKTQLSYAANLHGLVEEEHSGGALAFPSFDLGEDFRLSYFYKEDDHSYDRMVERYGSLMDLQPEGYGIDKTYPDIFYVAEDIEIDLRSQRVRWERDGQEHQIKLIPYASYILPSGYKVQMVNPETGQRWRLIGTTAEGLLLHKPCTVSGGGKSEISKPISDAMLSGPVILSNFTEDMTAAEEILYRDYSERYRERTHPNQESRALLSNQRSLGSVVSLLTSNPEYTDEYNEWLDTIPQRIKNLALTVKRFYRPHWGENWRERFHVDLINGSPGFELRYRKNPVVAAHVRIGYTEAGAWRTFTLRKDFWPAHKLQREDDITASVVVPSEQVKHLKSVNTKPSVKFVQNCEYRLFQRPDDAIIPGYDKMTEGDFSAGGNFFSNYEPLTRENVQELVDDAIRFQQFTEPMRESMQEFLTHTDGPDYFVCTGNPRLVDGVPTKNPRYLQQRPDLERARAEYIAEIGTRFFRSVPLGESVPQPVDANLPGRRNNPPEREIGIRSLAVYNPIHYQELPELFMEFTASLTGKSPSTTGAGSEGALTKGPFNALLPIVDLNNALVSYLVTESNGFTTAAGYVGHKYRMDHDVSLLVPEIWCRLHHSEQDPQWMIEEGHLEKLEDFDYNGETIPASRLGYRMTGSFARDLFGRVFSHPDTVFTEEMLKPELQGMENYVDGIKNIEEAQQKAALNYFADGSIELACPPIKALLHIMAYGSFEGKGLDDPELRALFTRDALLKSEWYHDRLITRYRLDLSHRRKNLEYLTTYAQHQTSEEVERLGLPDRILRERHALNEREASPEAEIRALTGTIGADPGLHPELSV